MRSLRDLFSLDEHGKILEILKPDGSESAAADLHHSDAQQWLSNFCHDVFNGRCSNRQHDCAEN